MNAEIIAVGSELLLGQIANTNAKFISEQLAELGINVFYHTVVGDNPGRLEAVFENAKDRSNLIIFTGGLGPTKDDLTKETIAKSLGRKLVYDQKAMDNIEAYFRKTNRVMSENNRKQALVIEGAEVLDNDFGMAPGMALYDNGMTYMLLPGPPKEMEPMFSNYGRSFLLRQLPDKQIIHSRVLRFFGIGESLLEAELEDLIDEQQNPTIAPLAGNYDVTLRLTAKFADQKMAARELDLLEEKIRERVGQFLYGYNDMTLADAAVSLLKEKSLTVAAAESLTGGMFGKSITDVPGSSACFNGSVVSYTNEVKNKLLHVPQELLASDGAVSEACARVMAENVRAMTASNIGISFTGVAGPGQSEGKEPGTVYIGVSTEADSVVHSLTLSGSRQGVRERTVYNGLFYLLQTVKGMKK
ncbi:competence/damage-inducible protein A [Fictibacillus gelatini]|uniref:competence/damage-inducible protein A n=1 Tax=Fictibacillus gelatini TaxID=225985 RepID=UPI0004211F92|nr:competence/damage-inducible protein A [Fictibacillus gelatini]